MTGKVIEVTVSPQGEVTMKTMGYVGADCLQGSKYLEQALGVVAREEKTAEFYQQVEAEQHMTQ